jgi:hypothetical protein
MDGGMEGGREGEDDNLRGKGKGHNPVWGGDSIRQHTSACVSIRQRCDEGRHKVFLKSALIVPELIAH